MLNFPYCPFASFTGKPPRYDAMNLSDSLIGRKKNKLLFFYSCRRRPATPTKRRPDDLITGNPAVPISDAQKNYRDQDPQFSASAWRRSWPFL
jgi:hypothetical protein